MLAFGDNLEHYAREAVHQLHLQHRSMLSRVRRTDFNYLTASSTLDRSSGFSGQVAAARGVR